MGRLIEAIFAIFAAVSLHAGGYMLSDWQGISKISVDTRIDLADVTTPDTEVEALIEEWEAEIAQEGAALVSSQINLDNFVLPEPEFALILPTFTAAEPVRRPKTLAAPVAPTKQAKTEPRETVTPAQSNRQTPKAAPASKPAAKPAPKAQAAKPKAASGPSKSQVAALKQSYAGAVRSAIASKLRAPKGVASGRVKLAVNLENGRLVGIGLAASSGSSALDKAALSAAKAARYPKPPKGLSGVHQFILPISIQ